ncbi:hypothetical protein PseBG33_2875 [Pseudomonas synxantha BG33R]|uniref:hypothetical protein n=1 Tax=Pseudomonas synxantha TaxID=47883 RepID=UPI00025FDCA9|nr:hypothetical protein [Pseudomonas synxantha]EIK72562.1 hypothetical protein PseBG33_2875 [Pseudomonas synxantha BG33R]
MYGPIAECKTTPATSLMNGVMSNIRLEFMYISSNLLKLVYPPISNQFAQLLWEDAEVRQFVKKSKLYMLAQRHALEFDNRRIDREHARFYFDLVCGKIKRKNLSVNLAYLIGDYQEEVVIDWGAQAIKISTEHAHNNKESILYWATTDKMLYDFWRGRIDIVGLSNALQFTDFNLYYVGISKEGDSFSRLFANGHKSRAEILSRETQYSPTARLTDELYIFLFDIDDFAVKELTESDFELPGFIDKKILAADAEKAFVKILQSKYNIVKYQSYPKGKDGLYGSGLTSYSYQIDEDITFFTATHKIRGCYNSPWRVEQPIDVIHVEGERVKVVSADANDDPHSA